MATVSREVQTRRRAPKKSPEFWVSFVAKHGGQQSNAFEIYVALDASVSGGRPFRTLVWPGSVPADRQMEAFATECFRAALGDTEFKLPDKAEKIVFSRSDNVLDLAGRGSIEARVDEEFNSSIMARDVDFLRIDHRAKEGVIGFSCRLLDDKDFEFAVLMEAGLSFTDRLLEWVLLHHQMRVLRDPTDVVIDDLREFLNEEWLK